MAVWAVGAAGLLAERVVSQPIFPIRRRRHSLPPPLDFVPEKFRFSVSQDAPGTLSATLVWRPEPSLPSCFYQVEWRRADIADGPWSGLRIALVSGLCSDSCVRTYVRIQLRSVCVWCERRGKIEISISLPKKLSRQNSSRDSVFSFQWSLDRLCDSFGTVPQALSPRYRIPAFETNLSNASEVCRLFRPRSQSVN